MGDNDLDILVEAYNFQGGQYKKLFDKKLEQFCTTIYMEAYKSYYDKFNSFSSVQVPFGTCPYPIVNNTLTNLLISNEGLLPPYLPGGEKWRMNVRYIKAEEVLGGYNLYVLVRSEQSVLTSG